MRVAGPIAAALIVAAIALWAAVRVVAFALAVTRFATRYCFGWPPEPRNRPRG